MLINTRLRLLSGTEPLMLDPTDGRDRLDQATDIFRYIDHNFARWNCDVVGPSTPKTPVRVYEMVRDSTFLALFGGFGVALESVALTQAQIKQFAKVYPDWLKGGGNGTFFLFENGAEFFVSAIYCFSDGRLGVRVRRVTLERVFRAQKLHRLVVRVVEIATS
jgi:hypothetical protein